MVAEPGRLRMIWSSTRGSEENKNRRNVYETSQHMPYFLYSAFQIEQIINLTFSDMDFSSSPLP
jgi:hypothetical protein